MGEVAPYKIPEKFPAWTVVEMEEAYDGSKYYTNSFRTQNIMETNDSRELTEEERESKLKQLFLESPEKVIVNFVD